MDFRDNETNPNIINFSSAKSERDGDNDSQFQTNKAADETKRYRILFPINDNTHFSGDISADYEPDLLDDEDEYDEYDEDGYDDDGDNAYNAHAVNRGGAHKARPFEVLRGGRYGEPDDPDAENHGNSGAEQESEKHGVDRHDHHDDKGGFKRIGEYLSKLGIVKTDADKRHFHVIKGGKSPRLNNEVKHRPSPAHTVRDDDRHHDSVAQNVNRDPDHANMRQEVYSPYQMVNPLSVVVVDENPAVLLSITSTLQSCGYAVRAYKNAYDALLAIKDDPCNVLIATSRMKLMSGATLVEFARNSGDALHALLLTDRWDNSVLNSMRKDRIDGFLIKPLSKSELLDKLNAIIDDA